MPKAAHDPTTVTVPPSRRGLLTGGTAALLAGAAIATAAQAAPTDGDAELVRLHRALLAQGEAVARAEAECEGVPYAECREPERRLAAADDAWYRLLGNIVGIPARTPVGLRVKAAVTLIAQQKYVCVHSNSTIADIVAGHEGDIEDRLALSIARDLLDWRASA